MVFDVGDRLKPGDDVTRNELVDALVNSGCVSIKDGRFVINGDSLDSRVSKLFDIWKSFFAGGNGHLYKLTTERQRKLHALATEQLAHVVDSEPEEVMRAICHAVLKSDFHMNERRYTLPESLFRNEERRARWTAEAVDIMRGRAEKNTGSMDNKRWKGLVSDRSDIQPPSTLEPDRRNMDDARKVWATLPTSDQDKVQEEVLSLCRTVYGSENKAPIEFKRQAFIESVFGREQA